MSKLSVSIEYSENFKFSINNYKEVVLVLFFSKIEISIKRLEASSLLADYLNLSFLEDSPVLSIILKMLQYSSWRQILPKVIYSRLVQQNRLIIVKQKFILEFLLICSKIVDPRGNDQIFFTHILNNFDIVVFIVFIFSFDPIYFAQHLLLFHEMLSCR